MVVTYRGLFIALALALLAVAVIGAHAEAAECRYTNSGRMLCSVAAQGAVTKYRHSRYSRRRGARHHREVADANGNATYAKVHTSTGLTATVIASAKDKFQGFINKVEEAGHKITDIGCKSRGHQSDSKHHWGGACDIMQRSRNVTAAFMYHVTTIARQFGLVDGCTFKDRRGPDCGHIEVPGPNVARRNESYRMAAR